MNEASSSGFLSRRDLLKQGGFFGAALAMAGGRTAHAAPAAGDGFRYALNFSTIRGQDLPVDREVDVAGRAGYDGIEPWIGKLRAYVEGGGKLSDLRRRIEDHGMTVESAIGFAPWIVDDPEARRRGMDEARRDMEMLAAIGGKRIAAPAAGATRPPGLDLDRVAERYRALLELGDEMGVVPQIEVWGGTATLGHISQAIYVALAADHPSACFLGDVYHLYKGGSGFHGLKLLGPRALQVFHFNDYPADPPRDRIGDGDRVYPGDGIAPIADIVRGFREVGAAPVLSLELFNREYWAQDALEVAKTGLARMKAAVASAG